MKASSTEQRIYALLEELSKPRKTASLEPFLQLMESIGNPHHTLPPVIHIAGTNGKGSVIAYLNNILQIAGYKVHATTSPHLVSVCERIQLSNQQISAELFLHILQEIKPLLKDLPLTYFEIITAIAFILFNRYPADFTLLETGLGGLYDATNSIEKPLMSAVTRIGFDHMDRFGNDLKKIALEKAGIIKQDMPVVTIRQSEPIMKIITEAVQDKSSPFYVVDPIDHDQLSLAGEHQKENAAIACKIIELINACNEQQIRQGLTTATWPGRLQKITFNSNEIWLDIAHNEMAAKAVVASMVQMKKSPFHLIFGIKPTKDIKSFLAPFKDHCVSSTYTPLPSHAQSAPFDEIKIVAQYLGLEIKYVPNVLEHLKKSYDHPVLITGSAVLVGEVLAKVH